MQRTSTYIGRAPVLFVSGGESRGTILLYHGLSASKETHLPEADRLVAAGFQVALVDNVGHGQRRYSDFEERFERAPEESFTRAVVETADETKTLVDRLLEEGLAQQVGIAGISMGGHIAYRALAQDPRLLVAACVIASPRFAATHDFYPTALLSQTAERDTVVPPDEARALHERITPHYRQAPERLSYIEVPEAEHMMTEDQWNEVIDNLVAWFVRFL